MPIQDVKRRIVSLLEAEYSGWSGFTDLAFVESEIEYKRAASEKAKQLLSRPALTELLQREDYEELFRRLFEVGNATNLLFKGVPKSGDLGVLLAPDLDKAALSNAIFALLHGTEESSSRLQQFIDFLTSRKLPTKWTFATYFLFLLRPDEDIYVRRTPVRWLLDQLGEEDIGSKPTGEAYVRIQQIVAALRADFADFGARDLIDVQSAIWVAASRDSASKSVGYWKIAPGEQAKFWPDWQKGSYASIGWPDLGDLNGRSQAEFIHRRDELAELNPGYKKNGTNQVWEFYKIAVGDRVVANRGMTEVVGIGTVTGKPYFVAGDGHGHRLPVHWDDVAPRSVNEPGWRRTLVKLDEKKFNKIGPIASGLPQAPPPVIQRVPQATYNTTDLAEETGFNAATVATWQHAMERKRQIIFYGPPGTGKTFVAKKLAQVLVAESDGFVETVQFHPSYGYEDFMQGIRPRAGKGGGLEYPVLPGQFIEFCSKAAQRSGICVLIIDEINRANLSRVFGELMYLLEYRDEAIRLAGGGEFAIPGNVRIIGTMNTADRSIALVDNALRRRFSFLPLRPEYDVLRRFHAKTPGRGDSIIKVLQRVNQAIGDAHYEIGISYFMRPDIDTQLESIWRFEIEPYLEEYFSDQTSKMTDLRWGKVSSELSLHS